MKSEKKIKAIKSTLERDHILPHQASILGRNIFSLESIVKSEDYEELVTSYKNSLEKWNLISLIAIQKEYIYRIIHSQHVEYEEIHKIFSLCEEIYFLEKVGLTLNSSEKKELKNELELFIKKEKNISNMVINEKRESWNKELWFYNL